MSPTTRTHIATVAAQVREFHNNSPIAAVAYVQRLRECADDFMAADPGEQVTHAFRQAAEEAEKTLAELTGGAPGALLMDRKDGAR